MSKYAVKIHCGGNRESFILMDSTKIVHEAKGDISRTIALFETKAAAKKGGFASICVAVMDWPFEIVTVDEAQKFIKNYEARIERVLQEDRDEMCANYAR